MQSKNSTVVQNINVMLTCIIGYKTNFFITISKTSDESMKLKEIEKLDFGRFKA